MPCDYKKYPTNWKSEIVPAILSRAGEVKDGKKITKEAVCEFCGVINHSYIYRSGSDWEYCKDWLRTKERGAGFYLTRGDGRSKVVLTIAHLDHDAENHSVTYDRLKALCQGCHNKYDAPFRAKNRKEKREKLIPKLF